MLLRNAPYVRRADRKPEDGSGERPQAVDPRWQQDSCGLRRIKGRFVRSSVHLIGALVWWPIVAVGFRPFF